MTAGLVLAGAPSSVTIVHAVAPSVYREVVTGDLNCHSGSYQGAFERLEPDDAKVSSPVPSGRGGGNAALLPDRHIVLSGRDLHTFDFSNSIKARCCQQAAGAAEGR